MEEDKALQAKAESTNGQGDNTKVMVKGQGRKVRDDEEGLEERYGEEDVDDEEG